MTRTMTATWRCASNRVAAGMAAGLLLVMAPNAALAQNQIQQTEQRLQRIENQLRALQRAVFPGGDQRFFEPEITPPSAGQGASGGAAGGNSGVLAAGALTDVLARLEAIELQLARLTAATEVNENGLRLLEMRMAAVEQMAAAAAQSGPAVASAAAPAQAAAPSSPAASGARMPASAAGGPSSANAAPAAASTASATSTPSAERLARVQAVLKPSTSDPGEDEYIYGYRLWEAQLYPEAQQQLALFLERYPRHPRTSYGRNLLGRAYLDAGDPRRAATYFFDNYQSDKNGARAPDSLLYLVEAMIALGDTNRACIALAEFGETYPALATGRLQQQYDRNRGRVTCQ